MILEPVSSVVVCCANVRAPRNFSPGNNQFLAYPEQVICSDGYLSLLQDTSKKSLILEKKRSKSKKT